MMNCKSCDCCSNRMREGMFGREPCFGWECCVDAEEAVKVASACEDYVPEDEEDDEAYIPSSTTGDYGPGNPWDAPGMSVSDFIR